jgi:hypothetical protein
LGEHFFAPLVLASLTTGHGRTKCGNYGGYSVTLDQGQPSSVNDNYVPDVFKNSVDGLASEEHNVEVTNEPTSTIAAYFDLDYVTIEREIGQDRYLKIG